MMHGAAPPAARATRRLILAPLVLGACVAGAATGSVGERAVGAPSRAIGASRADWWLTIRDFRWVEAVAVSERTAYFGTTAGLERWDTLRQTWLPPLTSADGLPGDRVTALAVEPLGGDVWVGTRRGLARLAGHDDRIEPVWGPPPAPVDALLFDARDGRAYALVSGAWWAGHGASFERVEGLPPGPLEGASRAADLDPARVPWVDPLYARGGAFPGLFRLTQVDRDLRGDWFAGTGGDNARRWRAGGAEWEVLYYGLAGPAGGPIVRAADGYWFAPGAEGGGTPSALAYASAELDTWSYVVPREEPALPAAVARAAVALGDTLVVGTDFGLAWGAGPAWRDAGNDSGIAPVAALASDGPVLWVGTEDGLVAWDPAQGRAVASALLGRRVTAIVTAPDALFVGAEEGLWAASRSAPPAFARDAAALADSLAPVQPGGRSIRGLALHGGLLLVASDRGLEVFDRATGVWRGFAVGEGRLDAPPRAVASDGENAWIGTDRGLLRWRPTTDEWRAYAPGEGLAGAPVRHLLAERDLVWASSPAGVTRFAWRAAEP